MELPVMWVISKATGQKVGINVSDFNADKHEAIAVGGPSPSDPESVKSDELPASTDAAANASAEKPVEPPFNLSGSNAVTAIAFIEKTKSVAALKAFTRKEKAGKKRKSVLKALDDRCVAILEEGEK